MPRHVLAVLVLVALVTATATACSSSGGSKSGGTGATSHSGSTGTSSSVCASIHSLESATRSLQQMTINSSDVSQVKAKLADIGTAVGQVTSAAKGQYPDEVAAIQHDYESLKSAVDIAVKDPTYPTVAQVKSRFTTFATAVNHFVATTAASC